MYYNFFFPTLRGLWDPRSPTRDRIHALSSEKHGVLTTGLPEISPLLFFNINVFSDFINIMCLL